MHSTASHLPADPSERRVWMKKNVQLLADENRKWPKELVPVPSEHWAKDDIRDTRIAVWRSKAFLVQIFNQDGHTRISVNRTCLNANGHFTDGIDWDTMQAIKSAVGYHGYWAVEIFPPDDQMVNVANIRHMFILEDAPPFAWRVKRNGTESEAPRGE